MENQGYAKNTIDKALENAKYHGRIGSKFGSRVEDAKPKCANGKDMLDIRSATTSIKSKQHRFSFLFFYCLIKKTQWETSKFSTIIQQSILN